MNTRDYLGLPYDIRGESGVNCWGLYRLLMKKERNIDILNFKPSSFNTCSISAKFSEQISLGEHNHVRVDQPKDLDLVVMTREVGRKIYHCGVYIGGNIMHAKGSGRSGQVWLQSEDELKQWDLEYWRYAE